MKGFGKLVAGGLVPMLMSGCANMNSIEAVNACVIGGMTAGATIGVALDGGVFGGLFGAGAGAVIGGILCNPEQEKPMTTVANSTDDETPHDETPDDETSDDEIPDDADGDGIADARDACAASPPEVSVDSNGCPFDSDGDGVADGLDRCPNTAKGALVDLDGCLHDSDGDGVADGLDRCPSTPVGVTVDDRGCPAEPEKVAIVTNINFDFDSARIRNDSKAKLDAVADLLVQNPDSGVHIVGHTDSTGTDAYNLDLSLRRATVVRGYLADRGIAVTRMSVAGKGEGEPLVSNRTRADRAVNRRVEFEVQ